MSSVNGVRVADRAGAVRELLRSRAIEVGLAAPWSTGTSLDTAIEALLDREVTTPEPTETECRRWYDAHPQAFVAGELVSARHILFAVAPGVPVEPLRRTAEKTLATLREHPERFAALARELSNCPSGAQGGALGQLAPGDCVPELDQALFGLTDEGLLPRLVSTRYGFHIVAIDARVPGRRVPFEAVREQIALRLAAEVAERALVQYVSVLAGQARLDDIDLAAAGSPLVQ